MVAVSDPLDALLDRLVVPGNSRVGWALRRRLSGWPPDPEPDALRGRVALVTGANSGLGKATAAGLARLGATVHMLGRDRRRTEEARDEVAEQVPGAELHVELCDLAVLARVREFAGDFAARVPRLQVLVHNAGVLPHRREETEEGNELNLATHVLGPFLLTGLLRPALEAGAPSRVIVVSSSGMYSQPLRSDDPQYTQERYRGAVGYARTKRMQVVMAQQWAQRLRGSGVVVHAAHPGWADTPGVTDWLPRFHFLTYLILRTPAEGADTSVWLAAAKEPGQRTGLFWHDRRTRPVHYLSSTRESAAQRDEFWRLCQDLTGLRVTT